MSHAVIAKAIGANGGTHVQFSQSPSIDRWARAHRFGMCLGFVSDWLISRYKGKDYLADYDTPAPSTSLLAEQRSALAASTFQDQSRGRWFDATCIKLATESMNHDAGKSNLNSLLRADVIPGTLSNLVLDDTARYFILYLTGDDTAHVIGIHRKYGYLSKSTVSYFFDPNFGQFECRNKAGLSSAISTCVGLYGNDVARNFALYAFTGSGW